MTAVRSTRWASRRTRRSQASSTSARRCSPPEDRPRPPLSEIATRFQVHSEANRASLLATASVSPRQTMFYETSKNDHGLPRCPFKAIVSPRPVGWVTIDERQGRDQSRALFVLQCGVRRSADRDVLLRRLQGFADLRRGDEGVRLQPRDLRSARRAVVATSASFPRGINEMAEAGLVAGALAACASAAGRGVALPRSNASSCSIVDARQSRGPAGRSPRRVRAGGGRPYRRELHQERPARHRRHAADRALRLFRLCGGRQGVRGGAAGENRRRSRPTRQQAAE